MNRILILLLVFLLRFSYSDTWLGVYEPLEGNLGGKSHISKNKDSISKLSFKFYIQEKKVMLKLISNGHQLITEDETYQCIILDDTEDWIQITPILPNKKLEIYTLFKGKNGGFLQVVSSYLGNNLLQSNPSVPYGTAQIFPIKKQ